MLARLGRINPVIWLLLVLLVMIVILSPNFLQPFGYMNFIRRAAPIAILAAGQVFVLTSGGFDLSQGALVTLTVIGSSILLGQNPDAVGLVIAAMFGAGVLVGVINGIVVSWLKVPSIIATLGMMISLGGIALTWSGGAPRGYLTEEFRFFGRYMFKDVPVVTILPVAVLVMIAVCAALWWIMHRTNYGKLLHAVGDNPRSAQLAGVPVARVRIAAFVLSSVSAVIAGILLGGFAGVSTDVGSGAGAAGDHRRGDRRRASAGRAWRGGRQRRRGAGAAGAVHAAEHAGPAETVARRGPGVDPDFGGGAGGLAPAPLGKRLKLQWRRN